MQPSDPKIYHITPVESLASILETNYLFSDKITQEKKLSSISIGMSKLKQRRLYELKLERTRPELYVGACVPFYFCPRSVMLFMFSKGNNPEITYRGGQEPIIHLEANMLEATRWAKENNKHWAFTTSNASSFYFEDYSNLSELDKINWGAVRALSWQELKEQKNAEFLIEDEFPWKLVTRIGVYSDAIMDNVQSILEPSPHKPKVEVLREWYY